MVADLVLGPLLRYADATRATVWVETDAPCEVEVLGHRARTFRVQDAHYAIVLVEGLEPATTTPYEVRLDGRPVWPRSDSPFPDPVIRTLTTGRTRIAFGSCRASAPRGGAWARAAGEHRLGRGHDALEAYAWQLLDTTHDDWPDLLLLLGDQVYADDAAPSVRGFARMRRDTTAPPGEDAADLAEHTALYRDAWRREPVRWLLSTVPSAMIFDDHDVIDDWNISAAWKARIEACDWWDDRIVGALTAYWCYQHLGNLSPEALVRDEHYRAALEADDAFPLLRDLARRADESTHATQWSYHRRLGDTSLVVVDSRAGRVLDEGARDMVDEAEWRWIEQVIDEPARHLLVATSVPVLLPAAIHDVERWNEHVCAGAWGGAAARAAEWVRQALDLEHWAAFGRGFDRLIGVLQEVASGTRGVPPETLAILSGDVHNGYVARGGWEGVERPLWQLVSSPLRQSIVPSFQRAYRFAQSPAGRLTGQALRQLARTAPPTFHWEVLEGPVLANHIGVLDLDGAAARVRIGLARAASPDDRPWLETAVDRELRGAAVP